MDGIATKERHDAFRGAGPGQTCRRATIAQTRGRHGVSALVEAIQHARAEGVARSNGTRDVYLGEVERPDGGRRRARSLRTFAGAPPGLKHRLLMLASMPRRGRQSTCLTRSTIQFPAAVIPFRFMAFRLRHR